VLPGGASEQGSTSDAAAASSSQHAPPGGGPQNAVEHVQRVEADLLRRKDELRAFEADYRQVGVLC
jgi:hypothetical protein